MPSAYHFLLIFGMYLCNGIGYYNLKDKKHWVRVWGPSGVGGGGWGGVESGLNHERMDISCYDMKNIEWIVLMFGT